jgi:hypothetical protein
MEVLLLESRSYKTTHKGTAIEYCRLLSEWLFLKSKLLNTSWWIMLLNLEHYIVSWFVDIAVKSIDLESTFEVCPKHGCWIIIGESHRKICNKIEVLCKVVYCITSTLKLSLMRKKIPVMNLGLLCTKFLQSLVSISKYLIIWHRTNQNEIKSLLLQRIICQHW